MEESSFCCNHPYGNQEDVNIFMTEFRPDHCPFNRTKPVTINDGTTEKEVYYVMRETEVESNSKPAKEYVIQVTESNTGIATDFTFTYSDKYTNVDDAKKEAKRMAKDMVEFWIKYRVFADNIGGAEITEDEDGSYSASCDIVNNGQVDSVMTYKYSVVEV
jgi:hypothetical protein